MEGAEGVTEDEEGKDRIIAASGDCGAGSSPFAGEGDGAGMRKNLGDLDGVGIDACGIL